MEDAQCAAPRGPERSPFSTKISAVLWWALGPACPVPGAGSRVPGAGCRVSGVGSAPVARPPSLPPARAARSALWVAPPPPPALYSGSCQRRRRSLAGRAGPRLLPAPDGAAGGSECAPAGLCKPRMNMLRPHISAPSSCFDTVLEYSLSFADKMGSPLPSST